MDSFRRLQDDTLRCLNRHEHQVADRPVLAAVSGGVDSTVLLLVLAQLRRDGRLPGGVQIGHVDHAVRADSRQNAQHVVDLAERLDVPVQVRRLPAGGPRPAEAGLRQQRYEALLEMATACNAGAIVLAHHADDNLETVLFRMLRGTGPRGLAGMVEARWHVGDAGRALLLRPFLRTRRATLESVLTGLGETAYEDSTNLDAGYARNQLRLHTIPRLRERLGVGLDVSLLTVTRTARAATEILDAQATRLLRLRGTRCTAWRYELDLRGLDADADPFLLEAVRVIARQLRPRHPAPSTAWLERVVALRAMATGLRIAGHGALLVERTRTGLLFVDPARAGGALPPTDSQTFAWDAGRQRFGATEWWLDAHEHPQPPLVPTPLEAGPRRALLDPRHLPTPWRLRVRRPGDRFQPMGHELEVDLRRWLMSHHLPRFDRDRLPLLVDATDRILWVPGIALAEPARLQLNTRRTIEVQLGSG